MFKLNRPYKAIGINGKKNLPNFAYYCRSINRCWSSLWKGYLNNNRNSSSHNNWNLRNVYFNFKDKEQPKAFFSEYRRHSKDIAKVISTGFGSGSELLGICRYVNGNLERNDPHVQSIEDIALAENHLENGYPKIWDAWEQLEQRIIELHNEISHTIKQFEETINSSIPVKFKPVTNYDPNYLLTQSIYYQRDLYSCLFIEINKQFNRVPYSRWTYLHDSKHKIRRIIKDTVQDTAQESFYVEPYFLADSDKTDLEEFKF